MQKEAQELGGKARFFTKAYEKYAWTKLMNAKLGGHDRLDLYIEAITSLSQNPHIPQLFRDIFKDTFLPYRNPETLSLFLKEVNGFSYGHSEDLGDAFEYLLSILGSQGDAGQFRTPRHIIDFIVAIVDPKKDETVCDPACGTAGFLISAYKHILKQHSECHSAGQKAVVGLSNSPSREGGHPNNQNKSLTPDEREKLMDHFVGYDISPDMVRLSKVNLYLHGFPSPTIFEYDTLSSEEKWGESFDVMLANPPFMSPKGGIRPHKRFSVQANRSEVLFVDYILEHLRLKGRAGIIVPEGIIFQSAGAYKALRKMLVEDGLMAVVSLPAGVFNPYAGVKTSVLFFDNEIVKKTKNILFLKIQNDGYDLGAQRRVIDKNDLPLALEIIKKYKSVLSECHSVLDTESIEKELDSRLPSGKAAGLRGNDKWREITHLVAKEKIAETGDYNLSGDRYKETVNFANQKWPMVELGEVCETRSGGTPLKSKMEYYEKGTISWLKSGEVDQGFIYESEEKITEAGLKNSSAKMFPKDTVLVAMYGATAGKVGILKFESSTNQAICGILPNVKIVPEFLYFYLKTQTEAMVKLSGGGGQPNISQNIVRKLKIPLPPIEVQKEIVEQIKAKQNAINHAKAIIQNLERERRYFGQSLRKLKDVEWIELGKLFERVNDQINPQSKTGSIVYVGLKNIESNSGNLVGNINSEMKTIKSTKNVFKIGDILYGKLRPNLNKVLFADRNGICSTDILVLRGKEKRINSQLYVVILRNEEFNAEVLKGLKGAQLPRISFDYLSTIKVPFLIEELQEKYLDQLKNEDEAIRSNKKLIEIYEQKIADVLSEI